MQNHEVPHIFCPKRRSLTFARAINRRGADWLIKSMQTDIIERLDFIQQKPCNAVSVGLDTALVKEFLNKRSIEVHCYQDLNEEKPINHDNLGLFISLGRLGNINDLPGALIHIRNTLKQGGLFLAQFIASGSFTTLRSIMLKGEPNRPAARVHPMIDDKTSGLLLSRAGFSKNVVDTYSIDVRYSTFEGLISDLRDQALTSILASKAPYYRKDGLVAAKHAFEEMRENDGKVAEKLTLLTLTAWR